MTADGTARMGAPAAGFQRLCERTLPYVPPEVLGPQYDRASTRIGIVHFGPGAFHRAHQASYFDRLLERDAVATLTAGREA